MKEELTLVEDPLEKNLKNANPKLQMPFFSKSRPFKKNSRKWHGLAVPSGNVHGPAVHLAVLKFFGKNYFQKREVLQ